MTDRGTATATPPSVVVVVTDYAPVLAAGGETVDPKRFLNVGGVATPIQ